MTNKKILAAMEGKHHDRKPPYSRHGRTPTIDEAFKQLLDAKTSREYDKAVDALNYVPPSKDDEHFKTCDFALDNQHMRDAVVKVIKPRK